MTMKKNIHRALPDQVSHQIDAYLNGSDSAYERLLDWALGPPLDTCNSHIDNVSCSRIAVLIIDASGSMELDDWEPSRLDGAKEAGKAYCDQIAKEDPNALISIIAYGSTAEVMCTLTPAGRIDELYDAIDRVAYLGGTNINAGLKAAIKVIPDVSVPCQVVLLSDGENTEQSPLRSAASLRGKAVVECVGIGGSPDDVDENLMKRIASAYPNGKKRYRWIGNKERLVKEFEKLAGRIVRP